MMYPHELIGQIVTRVGRSKNDDGSWIGYKIKILCVDHNELINVEVLDDKTFGPLPHQVKFDSTFNDNNWMPYPDIEYLKIKKPDYAKSMDIAYRNIEVDMEYCITKMRSNLSKLNRTRQYGIESFMKAKENLMFDQVNMGITGAPNCPFCIENNMNHNLAACSKCEYGTEHGICGIETSTYGKYMNARADLLDIISRYA